MSTSGEDDGDESLLNEDDDEESPTPEGYGRRDIRNRTNWLNRFDAVRIVHIRAANALFQSFEALMMLTTSLITYYLHDVDHYANSIRTYESHDHELQQTRPLACSHYLFLWMVHMARLSRLRLLPAQ
jgi:hypothetical protein